VCGGFCGGFAESCGAAVEGPGLLGYLCAVGLPVRGLLSGRTISGFGFEAFACGPDPCQLPILGYRLGQDLSFDAAQVFKVGFDLLLCFAEYLRLVD